MAVRSHHLDAADGHEAARTIAYSIVPYVCTPRAHRRQPDTPVDAAGCKIMCNGPDRAVVHWGDSTRYGSAGHRRAGEVRRQPRYMQSTGFQSCTMLLSVAVMMLDVVRGDDASAPRPQSIAIISGDTPVLDATSAARSSATVGVIVSAAASSPAGGAAGSESSTYVDGQLLRAKRGSFRGQTLTMRNGGASVGGHQYSSRRQLMMLSMPMTTGGLGDGLIALLCLFSLLFLSCFIGCNLKDGWKVYIPVFVVVLIVTLILVLAPKYPRAELEEKRELDKLKVFDMLYIPQVLLMTGIWVGSAAGLVIVLICHWAHPVYARALDD